VIAVLAIAAIVALLFQAWRYGQERERAEARWAAERSELLERIQRPERVPHKQVEYEMPDQEETLRQAREWARVGQIEIADDYGLDDDG
jgi:hypothetical protein